jgi:hypothetical protein
MTGMAFDQVRRGSDQGAAPRQAEQRPGTAEPGKRPSASSLMRPSGAVAGRLRPSAVPAVQRSLELGEPDDSYEREADAVASAVVSDLLRPGAHVTPAGNTAPSGRRIRRRTDSGPGDNAADAATAARIESAQTGGTPLESSARRSLEQAFGADFSAVRLHTGPEARLLSRQINATAFTVGSDIFFRDSPPDMSSAAGQHLLAHELTHTVQQRASSGVVQRRIGFEFETGIDVKAKDGSELKTLDYQEELFVANSGQWKIVADADCLEFVTEPFQEDDGGKNLLKETMKEIVGWAGKIPDEVARAASEVPPRQGLLDKVDPAVGKARSQDLLGRVPYVIDRTTLTDAEILASPQATGGVTLSQVPALIDAIISAQINAENPKQMGQRLAAHISKSDQDIKQEGLENGLASERIEANLAAKSNMLAYQEQTNITPEEWASSLVGMNILHASWLVEAKEKAAKAVDPHVAGQTDRGVRNFDKLKGLLALVISYLLVGEREPEVMKYSKVIAPLMARTNFYVMFNLLDQHEKDLFTENFVLGAAGMAGTGGTQIFVRGFKYKKNKNDPEVTEHGPTRSAWIDSIRHGSPGTVFGKAWRNPTDLLSRGSGSIASQNSTSLGSMSVPDYRATGELDLAVLELRRIPKNIQREEWTALALMIFNTIRRVRRV